VTADIESDHIAETFDAGVDEATGAPFLVMELLRGDDLEGILGRCGPFTAEETVALLSQAALALDRTHAAGIVHRDLKPPNLFLSTRDDGSSRLKILDFGIAKVVADGTRTAPQTAVLGTPIYMSPEQATGDGAVGPATDLYALGHIAYTLLTGDAYWTQEYETLTVYPFLSRLIAGADEPPSVRAGRRGIALPAAFDAWFARATARLPSDRFVRASVQIAELATALGTPSAPELLIALRPIGERASSRAPRRALAVAALAAGAVGLFAVGRVLLGEAPQTPATGVATSIASAAVTAAEAIPSAPAPAVEPAVSVATTAPAATARPAATTRPRAPEPVKTVRPSAASCDPPYEVDGAGRRHMKPQCL
jgi:serine/threonine-protein kinase